MPRQRYRITAADVKPVHRWIRERLRNDAWPEDWPRLTAWDKFPYEKPTVKTLQRWCDRFLDAQQWKQLQAVIRSARRDPSRYRTVRLSRNAHEILRKLARRDKLTLSEVIKRYLSSIDNAPAQALQIAEQPSSHITSPQAYTQANPPATIKEEQSEID
jgi:predicted DNA-binding ribbon-helix-helix protein